MNTQQAQHVALNDAAHALGKPVVFASVHQYEGQLQVVDPTRNGACLRCIWPQATRDGVVGNCAEAGVLGVLPGIIGSIQALEAIKVVLHLGDPLIGRLLAYDALEESFRTFTVRRDPMCPTCSEHAAPITIAEYDQYCLPHATLADGTWTEVGDRIMPGRPPVRFFEMRLRRVSDSDWPAANGPGPH